MTPTTLPHLTHLQRLEAESIQIMREVVAVTENPVMLYSIGKDSAVMLHLAMKAFYPGKPPFPLLHVDTTWKFSDMYALRDRMARELDLELLVHTNPDVIFCTIVLLGTIGFSFGTVAYSISGAGQQTLRRPSLRRFSIDWWHDPLQCLFLSCGFAAGMALGAAFRLPGTSTTGFWTFMFFVCLFLGLLIGQLGVYLVHHERITNT